jgi:uncharacterized protein (TIGR02001 family)
MKPTNLAIPLSLVLASLGMSAAAADEFSGNVALTTDYVWRGISQTDNGPAIQGGFDFAHASGFYLGTWASNVEFGDDANVEIDLYGGYAMELESGLSLDVGLIHYDYPSESDLNFEEIYVGVGYDFFSAMVSYDPDNKNAYWDLGADFTLPGEVALGLHYGYYDFDDGSEYNDWKLALGKSYSGFDFELAYTDTDIDDEKLADGRVIFTITKSL